MTLKPKYQVESVRPLPDTPSVNAAAIGRGSCPGPAPCSGEDRGEGMPRWTLLDSHKIEVLL